MNIYDVTTEQVGQAYLTWLVAYRYQAACVKAFNRTQDEDDEHGKDAEYKDSLDKIGDLQRAMHVAGEAHRKLIELADLLIAKNMLEGRRDD